MEMQQEDFADRFAKEVMGNLVLWALGGMAVAALIVGIGIGAALSLLIAFSFPTWSFWVQALPGTGWAILIAMVALWASMDDRRRFLYF